MRLEHGAERIVRALLDGIVLVIVTARAVEGQAEKGLRRVLDGVVEPAVAVELEEVAREKARRAESWMMRPDRRPAQLGVLMEALAGLHADGSLPLERFLQDLRPHLSGFNTLMIITPSRRPEWVSVLVGMRRQGVNVAVCYVDPSTFADRDGAPLTGSTGQTTADYLAQHDVPVYLIGRGDDINQALSRPLTPRTAPADARAADTERVAQPVIA